MAGLRWGRWLLLGPGRGRRDDEEGWEAGGRMAGCARGQWLLLGPGGGRRDDGEGWDAGRSGGWVALGALVAAGSRPGTPG